MNKLDYNDLIHILRIENRNNWKNEIEPYILDKNLESRTCYIDDGFKMNYNFLPEELDPNFNWKFNIDDIVTDGKNIMKITTLPELDPRKSEYDPELVLEFGNIYEIVRIDKDGNDIESEDPWAYLHQKFNQNQIHLASKEEIERLLK